MLRSALVSTLCACATTRYPQAERQDVQDTFHGVSVADPYRWLEDPDAPATRTWIDSENQLTRAYLDDIPGRSRIHQRLTELWNYEKFGVPIQRGARLFFQRNDGLQNQPVLYVVDAAGKPEHVAIDPNALSQDGTVALKDFVVSPSGRYVAYGLAQSGSDWVAWRVLDVDQKGQNGALNDYIEWTKFSSVAWDTDDSGFYYSRYAAPQAGQDPKEANYHNRLYHHRLGAAQAEDTLIYERPDEKEWGFGPWVTDDGRYLIVTVWKGTDDRYQVFYRDLRPLPPRVIERGGGPGWGASAEISKAPGSPMVELFTGFDAGYLFVANEGAIFYFKTTKDAPRGRLVSIDVGDVSAATRKLVSVVPETEDTLEQASLVGGRFFLRYLKDARSLVRVVSTGGEVQGEVALPGVGTVDGFNGMAKDSETYFSFAGFQMPTHVYRLDTQTLATFVFRAPKLRFEPQDYVTEQVFFQSADGTRMPMFVSHKRAFQKTGAAPVYLYGYGGFNISITPGFSVSGLLWMERGGIYAVANLRGGGEFGEAWHQAGQKLSKQNVFDDFQAAAKHLVASGYTTHDQIAIHGRSNGGLLVGACITQAPELFGAALADVGVMDMLRFHRFTIGWAWVDDYGSADNPDEFRALYAYSPYHNAKPRAYPPTLITTADHDDRVVPGHSFKFAAAVQHAQQGSAPVLIRIETEAGHGAGTPTSKLIDEATDKLAFLEAALGF